MGRETPRVSVIIPTYNRPSDEVHVWWAALDLTLKTSCRDRLWATLSADERTRAERFRFSEDRMRFVSARGILRILLGRYLDVEPQRLRFCYNEHGKPALAPEFDRSDLQFNVSHSDSVALYAVAWGRRVGVDVERIRTDVSIEAIAQRFFSPQERAALGALPAGLRREAFYSGWTRKEAFLKARGEGLSLPLDQFDVSLLPGEPAALLYVAGDQEETSRWSFLELTAPPGYAATLAVEGRDLTLRIERWRC
jgi:4'-phosphopantetheinyl transferase